MRRGSKTKKIRILQTTQNNVVIPTAELIKDKGVDLRILACISTISNVDDWTAEGSNERYCSIAKLNKNLSNISELLKLDRTKLMQRIRDIRDVGSDEFKTAERSCENKMTSCVEIRYVSGGFVVIDCALLEKLVSTLSKNAFKLYINLLWLCKDKSSKGYIEKAISQEYLCEIIGLSKSSTKTVRKLEQELIDNNLLSTRVEWESSMTYKLNMTKPRKKKYYKLLCA